ncbi:MAG TPA: serine hydrolase domain-containing protein [Noviherbaspirillum sp.]|uniref:serine hydrolase domain-containing protein n=1 Tax=Noviherbaspirillum sp. TaxID=1926288 RepID=UPI002B487505|nr:serine hydrolase domain-containing protein [Noviherbaspirillum sp.]HJV87737.1 serine hydrolase domain-containing protein [Noviherbaspirillum sp.]
MPRRLRCLAAVFMATAAFTASCTAGAEAIGEKAQLSYAATRQHVADLIRVQMRKQKVTGLSIALVDNQDIVWAEGFGFADKSDGIPATAETVYRAGSITRLFTVMAAMQLAEQGRLDIDQPLQTWLPQFAMRSRFAPAPITPRMLMSHHSGLPADYLRGMWTAHPEPFTRLANKLRDEYVAYPPNFVMSYSNLGATLLGHVVQQASGEDFISHVERTLLRPLGMTHSSLSVRPEAPLMSKAYRKGKVAEESPLRDVPAGGLNSSVLDLGRFLQMVFADGRFGGQQIIKPATLAEMMRRQNAGVALDVDFAVGLGWMLVPLKGVHPDEAGPTLRHAGGTQLFRSAIIALPKHKLGVIMLANSPSAASALNEISAEALTLALEEKTGIKSVADTGSEAAQVQESELRAFGGYYATAAGFAKVSASGNTMRVELLGRRFRLVPRSNGSVELQYRFLGLFPIALPGISDMDLSLAHIAGHDVLLASSNGQRMLAGERIHPEPIGERWMARLGEYEIVNGESDAFRPENMALRLRDGFLVFEALLPDLGEEVVRLAVRPVSETELVILGLGRQMGETIRVVEADGEERLAYSGYLLRKKAGW